MNFWLKNGHLWPNIGFFGPLAFLVILGQIFDFLVHIGAIPDQKAMRTGCLVNFLICEYKYFCSLAKKIRILAKKRPNLTQNMHFCSIWAWYWPFWSILVLCPIKKTMRMRCLGGYLICGYQNFCSVPKWLGCLARKRPFLPQNMLPWAVTYRPYRFIWCPVGWLFGGCGVRAVSCKTSIYSMY